MKSKPVSMSLLELDDLLDDESFWRKKELFQCLTSVQASSGPAQKTALRAGIALLYAHWEGWVKATGRSYLKFVNAQYLPLSALAAPLVGAGLKTRLAEIDQANKAAVHAQFAEYLQSEEFRSHQEIDLELIRSDSNLSAELFEDILTRIGVEKDWYELRFTLIEKLRRARNKVAHGDYSPINQDTYSQLHENILEVCTRFDTDVRKLARESGYLSKSNGWSAS